MNPTGKPQRCSCDLRDAQWSVFDGRCRRCGGYSWAPRHNKDFQEALAWWERRRQGEQLRLELQVRLPGVS